GSRALSARSCPPGGAGCAPPAAGSRSVRIESGPSETSHVGFVELSLHYRMAHTMPSRNTPPDTMARRNDPGATLVTAWRTNSRVTAYLVEQLPAAVWEAAVPGAPRRTVRMIAGHMHNARCQWVKTLGSEHGIAVPAQVDRRTIGRRQLLTALTRSARGIEALLELGLAAGGRLPPSQGYVWRNLPL